jgi:DNA repair exonuclease SbcCD ATPase subunit
MKILTATVSNFGSYKNLTVDFQNQGLTLISGPTGAGKSTLCDIIPWILWGRTAKGGAVDEVRAWGCDKRTSGYLEIETQGKTYRICRSRNNNDLYYYTMDEPPTLVSGVRARGEVRGKDLNDTQKLINDLLGIDLDLYLAGAYFHEFSQTAGFFTANAKARRTLTEQLVDLTLATKIADGSTELKKQLKLKSSQINSNLVKLEARIEQLDKTLEETKNRATAWDTKQVIKITGLRNKVADFGIESRAKYLRVTNGYEDAIRDLEAEIKPENTYELALKGLEMDLAGCSDESCPTCGVKKGDPNRFILFKKQAQTLRERDYNTGQIARLIHFEQQLAAHLKTSPGGENPYEETLEAAKAETNPHTDSTHDAEYGMAVLLDEQGTNQLVSDRVKAELSDVELLLEITAEFRKKLILSTVSQLETLTNKFLTDYFDAEIRVSFSADDADKLDVSITKNGNLATYTQLSKGQRQLLKLCFGVSVMKIAPNHNGISFNAIFMDEFADGLDEIMKTKAYRLLEYLATQHESVFAIDHSESLKSMFANKWEVSLVNGESQIEKN